MKRLLFMLFCGLAAIGGSAQQSGLLYIDTLNSQYLYVSPDNIVYTDSAGLAAHLYGRTSGLVRPIEDSLAFRVARKQYEQFTGLGYFQVRQDSLTDQLAGQWEIERVSDSTIFNATVDSSGVITTGNNSGQIQIMTFRAFRVDGLPISPIYLSQSTEGYTSLSGAWIMRRQ